MSLFYSYIHNNIFREFCLKCPLLTMGTRNNIQNVYNETCDNAYNELRYATITILER